VVGVDLHPSNPNFALDAFYQCDLNRGLPPLRLDNFDYILLLDVIEHLAEPELFMELLRDALKFSPHVKLIVSTGNIGFFITRFALLLGQFNYGSRGILDITHTRLFNVRFATPAVRSSRFSCGRSARPARPLPFGARRWQDRPLSCPS